MLWTSLSKGNESHMRINRVKINDVMLDQILVNLYNDEYRDSSCSQRCLSVEDRDWQRKVENSCKVAIKGNYEIGLPFRDDNPSLPNNMCIALKRLECLKRKFMKNERFYRDYVTFMNDIIDKGQAEVLSYSAQLTDKGVWYIPHYGVYHLQKPDKIRVKGMIVEEKSHSFGVICLSKILR